MSTREHADTNPSVLARARTGDRQAFDAIVAAHGARAVSFAAAVLRDRDEARDVAQEAFVRAWTSIGRFDPSMRFEAWLHTIVHNLAIDRLRQRRRPESLDDHAHHLATVDDDTATMYAGCRTREAIGSSLDALSPEHYTVIVLREVEGYSYQEIADRTGVPIGTVMSRIHHAREKMKTLLLHRLGDDLKFARR